MRSSRDVSSRGGSHSSSGVACCLAQCLFQSSRCDRCLPRGCCCLAGNHGGCPAGAAGGGVGLRTADVCVCYLWVWRVCVMCIVCVGIHM